MDEGMSEKMRGYWAHVAEKDTGRGGPAHVLERVSQCRQWWCEGSSCMVVNEFMGDPRMVIPELLDCHPIPLI